MSRALISKVVNSIGLADAVLRMRRASGRSGSLTVLAYHRVVKDPARLRPAERLVTVDAASFERQIEFLASHFTFVGLDEVRAFIAGAELPPSAVLVTFDDGYRDNHDVALPILVRHGARAVFFVATQYVDERKLFWWDRIDRVISGSPCERIEIEYPIRAVLDLPSGPRERAVWAALEVVKTTRDLDLPRYLHELERVARVSLDATWERETVDAQLMTWEHVASLHRAGMDVQSHSHAHRVFATLSPSELGRDLLESRARLEDVLGSPVRALAYPVGRPADCTRVVREVVRSAGFDLAFSLARGVNRSGRVDPFAIHRITPEGLVHDDHFRAAMALPQLAF